MTVSELLDEAVAIVESMDCRVQEDWFDGRGGGLCVVRGEKRLLLDVAQTTDEQLEVVLNALRELGFASNRSASAELQERIAKLG